MEMAQRHIGEVTGEHAARDRIPEDVGLTLPTPCHRPEHREMAHQEIHRVGSHPGGETLDDPPHPILVDAGVLIRV
jgi:hypothetical protein